MTIKLYDLAAAEDDRRFSPYCWRIRMALAHKGLAGDTIPWRFTEKDAIAFSGQGTVPVLVDGEKVVSDSWAIANYLEDAYPDRPSLFGGATGRGLALFVKFWVEQTLNPALMRICAYDMYQHLHEKDKAYFRETREKRFGMPLEQLAREREGWKPKLTEALAPLRATLSQQPFVAGAAPAFADYAVFGVFQWARCISDFKLLQADDLVYAWRGRMLDLHGGLAARAKGYAV